MDCIIRGIIVKIKLSSLESYTVFFPSMSLAESTERPS